MAGASLVPDLPLYQEEADLAVAIFDSLRIPDVSGRPLMRDAAPDWIRDIVRAIFGAYDAETQVRHIQELFILLAKKNGKTSYSAAIMIVAILMNRRPEAELLMISMTIEIAKIAFRQAKGIIRADPQLEIKFLIQDHIRQITYRPTNSILLIKAADTDVVTGGKQAFTLIDELHVLSSKPNAADIMTEIRGSLAARPDGFLIIITTQSKGPPSGIFKDALKEARAVRDGKIKRRMLPVMYEFPEELGPRAFEDEKNWPIVLPNLGRSVNPEFIREQFAKAQESGAEALALFASQHFNAEIGLRLRADRWGGADYWEAAAEPDLTLDELLARCDVATIGIDGGGLDDLLGLCVCGREIGTRKRLLWFRAWCHEKVLHLRQGVASRLRDFERDGDLTIYGTIGDDIKSVCDVVAMVVQAGKLPDKHGIGVDVAGISQLVDALRDPEGLALPDEMFVAVAQGWKLAGTINSVERRLGARDTVHGGQPLMAWCVGNAKVELKGNNRVIEKQAAGEAKIDPVIAMFNAEWLMDRNPQARQRSPYELHGLRTL
jgi:phage terminase large subunit-like protein